MYSYSPFDNLHDPANRKFNLQYRIFEKRDIEEVILYTLLSFRIQVTNNMWSTFTVLYFIFYFITEPEMAEDLFETS